MPRRLRRSYRRSRPVKTVKYSNETSTFSSNSFSIAANGVLSAIMIPDVAAQGMRKAKNFTLRMLTSTNIPIAWALVYVPEGMDVGQMAIGTPSNPSSLYEPSQNVIMSGYCFGTGTSPTSNIISRTRLARNLNSGDRIYLTIMNIGGVDVENAALSAQLNYVITY